MIGASYEHLQARIDELESRLAESEQLIEAIKDGQVDAFAFNKNNKPEIYTLQSGDYAYRILIENFNEGALNLSEDGLIVYTNTYFYELLQVTYEKVIGKPISGFIHSSSKKDFKELFKKGLAGQCKGEINLSAGDKVIPVYVSLTSLYPTLPTVGMIVTDLSAKKKQELLLKQQNDELAHSKNFINNILDSTDQGVVFYLAIRKNKEIVDFEILYANKIALEQLNLPAAKAIGKTFLSVIPEAKELGLWQRIARVLETGVPENHEISSYAYPDRFFKARFAPLDDGVTVTFVEITEQKQYARILEEKNHELAKMNEALESFNFASSHDLQEPLRKIELFSGFLLREEEKNLSGSGRQYLQRMQSTVRQMRTLIKDLLAYFQVKNAESKFEKTDLHKIIADAIADFEDTIDEKKATINTVGLCEINVIQFQFRQLFDNLISNALKFSDPARPPKIDIVCSMAPGKELDNAALAPEALYCHLSFSDNGIGFAPVYKDRIFEAFQRLHEYDNYKGTGLGLAICRKVVENHGGIITATGAVNQGARFDICIPVK